MESLGYKQKNKMVYQMIENMKQKSIDFDQFLDMMTARIVRTNEAQPPRAWNAVRVDRINPCGASFSGSLQFVSVLTRCAPLLVSVFVLV